MIVVVSALPFLKPIKTRSSDRQRSLFHAAHVDTRRFFSEDVLAGMEQKLLEQMNAVKSEPTKPVEGLPFPEQQQASMSRSKDHKPPRQPNLPPRKESAGHHASMHELPRTYEGLYEVYKKNPDMLRHRLQSKVLF